MIWRNSAFPQQQRLELTNDTEYAKRVSVTPSHPTRAVLLQVTPCAQSIGTDDPDFTTDSATQTAGIDLIADIIDTAVRLRQSGAERLESRLRELVGEKRVIDTEVDTGCLVDSRAMPALLQAS